MFELGCSPPPLEPAEDEPAGPGAEHSVARFAPMELATCPPGYTCDDSRLHVRDEWSAAETRAKLIDHIWRGRGFPFDVLPKDAREVDSPISSLPNLSRVVELTYVMSLLPDGRPESFVFHAYHFVPQDGANRLALVHQGHDNTLGNNGVERTIRFLLSRRFDVVALQMPLYGTNSGPFSSHSPMFELESESRCGIQFFMEPVAAALNYMLQLRSFVDVTMIGISGGGWTTDLYSSLDTRVRASFSVAGSLPLDVRNSKDDTEQHHGALYEIADYRDIYVLAGIGPGRSHYQILNPDDNCCFSGTKYRSYENLVGAVARSLGGDFRVYLDRTIPGRHAISQAALDTPVAIALDGRPLRVLDDSPSGFGYPGALYGDSTVSAGEWRALESGFDKRALEAASDPSGRAEVIWTFRGLEPALYRVAATWVPADELAGDATYRLLDGTSTIAVARVDQRVRPERESALSANWQDLVPSLFVSGGTLQVRLDSHASGPVVADAVAIERKPAVPGAQW